MPYKALQGLACNVFTRPHKASQHAVGTLERGMQWDFVTACENIYCGITACGHASYNLTHGVACGHTPQYDLDCVCLFFTFLYMPSVSDRLSEIQKGTRQSGSHKDHHGVERAVEVSCSPKSVQCASATSTMAGLAHRSTTCTE